MNLLAAILTIIIVSLYAHFVAIFIFKGWGRVWQTLSKISRLNWEIPSAENIGYEVFIRFLGIIFILSIFVLARLVYLAFESVL
ncbi:MAG: hypothetical protein K9J12_15185 [Melioribacteraceae bacterium]|nr:hypothetical protein [Melioribacteraceae bacterium]MCF8263121.1 hypothetical protein [Melioribacteraceae bacterium]MCF8430547.1 hypothetical protein [Melioribacteraceae bacterium]